jgi:hypothetical protein
MLLSLDRLRALATHILSRDPSICELLTRQVRRPNQCIRSTILCVVLLLVLLAREHARGCCRTELVCSDLQRCLTGGAGVFLRESSKALLRTSKRRCWSQSEIERQSWQTAAHTYSAQETQPIMARYSIVSTVASTKTTLIHKGQLHSTTPRTYDKAQRAASLTSPTTATIIMAKMAPISSQRIAHVVKLEHFCRTFSAIPDQYDHVLARPKSNRIRASSIRYHGVFDLWSCSFAFWASLPCCGKSGKALQVLR